MEIGSCKSVIANEFIVTDLVIRKLQSVITNQSRFPIGVAEKFQTDYC
jgi:hypothetical protein